MLNADASLPGGRQAAVSVGAIRWTPALRSVRPAGRRAVLCRLWEGLGHKRRSEVLVRASTSGLYFQRGVIMCWVCVGNGKMTCSCFLSSRETRLCGGQTVFCVLLQPEESERSLHLCSSGSEGASKGTSKTLCSTDKNALWLKHIDRCWFLSGRTIKHSVNLSFSQCVAVQVLVMQPICYGLYITADNKWQIVRISH